MQLLVYTASCFAMLVVIILVIAAMMYLYSIVKYHTDGWYAARYGRPMFWPFNRRRAV